MSTFEVGYFVCSLSNGSSNRKPAHALGLAPPGLELEEVALGDLPLYRRRRR